MITAEVHYVKDFGGVYMMNMTSQNTGAVSSYHYKLLKEQKETESVGYFVLEHQPDNCNESVTSSAQQRSNSLTCARGARGPTP